MIAPMGQFRIQAGGDDLSILSFVPKTREERVLGVPLVAFALWKESRMIRDDDKFVRFLNASIKASHGDFEDLRNMLDK